MHRCYTADPAPSLERAHVEGTNLKACFFFHPKSREAWLVSSSQNQIASKDQGNQTTGDPRRPLEWRIHPVLTPAVVAVPAVWACGCKQLPSTTPSATAAVNRLLSVRRTRRHRPAEGTQPAVVTAVHGSWWGWRKAVRRQSGDGSPMTIEWRAGRRSARLSPPLVFLNFDLLIWFMTNIVKTSLR